jgi:hypothetical protein
LGIMVYATTLAVVSRDSILQARRVLMPSR